MAREELKPVFDFCEQNGFDINSIDPLQLTFTISKKKKVKVGVTELNNSLSNEHSEIKLIITKSVSYVSAQHLAEVIEGYLNGDIEIKIKKNEYKKFL